MTVVAYKIFYDKYRVLVHSPRNVWVVFYIYLFIFNTSASYTYVVVFYRRSSFNFFEVGFNFIPGLKGSVEQKCPYICEATSLLPWYAVMCPHLYQLATVHSTGVRVSWGVLFYLMSH